MAWQRATLERNFEITIADPQTISSTFSSYTHYLTASTLCPDGIRRRFSDFDWLREILVARFHGIAVPLMPEKRLVGNQGSAFIAERMAGLETFLVLVLANPYLREDATLKMFLTQKNQAEFDQAKKATLQGMGADPASNAGLGRWYNVLRHLKLPVDADAACRELQAYCAKTEQRLVGCLGAVTRFYDAAKALSDSLRAVRDSLSDLHTECSALAGALTDTLAPVRNATGSLGTRVKKGADAFSQAFDLSVFAPNEIQIFLLDGIISEIHRVKTLKSLLDTRDSAQSEYSAAWVAQEKLQFQDKQNRDKGRADLADKAHPKMVEAVQLMKQMKERLDDIGKGILHIEADRIATTRIERVVAMTGQFAALCIASGVRGQELWTGFLGSMELSQESMVRDAQATLTIQTSMHSLDATGPAVAYVLPSSVIHANGGPTRIAINSVSSSSNSSASNAASAGGAEFSGGNPLASKAVASTAASEGAPAEV